MHNAAVLLPQGTTLHPGSLHLNGYVGCGSYVHTRAVRYLAVVTVLVMAAKCL